MEKQLPRVMCVDDEQNILNAIARNLRGALDLTTVTSAPEALTIMRAAPSPFQVVVSDMRMPTMTGAIFLSHVRCEFPDTVRILLTGFAELEAVVSAVNDGNIFRFLAKPCSTTLLLNTINDAVRQNELLTSEKVLLEQTLRGSIEALTSVLSLASPVLFGRASRIRQIAEIIAVEAGIEDRWQIEVAAHLSQIGRITLPDTTATKLATGEALSIQEEAMVARMPEVTASILGRIPRLEAILEILSYQGKNYDGSGEPKNRIAGEEIPIAARILKMAGRIEELQDRGFTGQRILDSMRVQRGVYDPALMKAYEAVAGQADEQAGPRGIAVGDLRIGMLMAEPVRSQAGVLLVAGGQEVTEGLLNRIRNYHDTIGLQLPLWIRPRIADEAQDEAELQPEVAG